MLTFTNKDYYTGDFGNAIGTYENGNVSLVVTIRMSPSPKHDSKSWKFQRENRNKERQKLGNDLFVANLERLLTLKPGESCELNSNTKVERM